MKYPGNISREIIFFKRGALLDFDLDILVYSHITPNTPLFLFVSFFENFNLSPVYFICFRNKLKLSRIIYLFNVCFWYLLDFSVNMY